MGYKLSTYQKATRSPVGSPSRLAAIKAARAELLAAGCEFRQGGNNLDGWGKYWYTKDNDCITRSPVSALEAVIRFRIDFNK